MSRLTSWALAAAMLFAADASAAVLARQSGAVGVVTYDPPPASGYEAWAAANGIEGAWNETDALGIHNVFRYAFDKPSGAFTEPPLLDIAIEDGNAVVKTPPVANAEGFAVSVVESSDIAGATITRRLPPDAAGRAVFAMEGADSRFYRLAAAELGGVQLWEGGPYWAECNVGASAPEEYGYYFWWGDTVGYTHTGSAWVSVKDGTNFSFNWSNVPTYGKDNETLLADGYIDATGNLAAGHDAATAHLGWPWRMPTDDENVALASNCTTAWITTNGVYGRLVTGKGDYADRSIFLPAAGYGADSFLYNLGSYAYYWGSTVYGDSIRACCFYFYSNYFGQQKGGAGRQNGRSVRPVRDAD